MAGKERANEDLPVVVVTGATGAGGAVGTALVEALRPGYRAVGLDRAGEGSACEIIEVDLGSPDSVRLAGEELLASARCEVASVFHLAAYFRFHRRGNPLYEIVNVESTRNLMRALGALEVEQLIYSGMMLVHRPRVSGVPITEATEIAPKWAHPQSKAAEEASARSAATWQSCCCTWPVSTTSGPR